MGFVCVHSIISRQVCSGTTWVDVTLCCVCVALHDLDNRETFLLHQWNSGFWLVHCPSLAWYVNEYGNVDVPLCPTPLPLWLSWERTPAPAITNGQLTAWFMAWQTQWTFGCLVTFLWHGKHNGPLVVWLHSYGMANTIDLWLSGYILMAWQTQLTFGCLVTFLWHGKHNAPLGV